MCGVGRGYVSLECRKQLQQPREELTEPSVQRRDYTDYVGAISHVFVVDWESTRAANEPRDVLSGGRGVRGALNGR